MDPRRRRARTLRKLQRRLPDLRLLAEDTQVAPARAQGCPLVRAYVVTRREADRLRRGLGSLRENNRSDDQDRLARDEQAGVGDEAEAQPDRCRSGLVAGRPHDRVCAPGSRATNDLRHAPRRTRDAPPHARAVTVLVARRQEPCIRAGGAPSTASASTGRAARASSVDWFIHSCGGRPTDASSSTRPAKTRESTPGSWTSTALIGDASFTTNRSRGSRGDLDSDRPLNGSCVIIALVASA